MIIESIDFTSVKRFIDFDLENDAELLEIIELAAAVTGSSYALISLLYDEMAYFRVRKGIVKDSLSFTSSFCFHTILQDELLIIPDTLADGRYAENAYQLCPEGIRFYAAMPLTTRQGQKLGTLCVLDSNTNNLDDHQQLVLKILANQVTKILELREGMELLEKNARELTKQKELNINANIRLRSFFESSTNFQILLGKDGEVIDFNKTAFSFIKAVHKCELKRGDQFVKYLHPEFVSTFIDKYNIALEGKKCAVEGSTDYDELGVIWWEASFEAARDSDNSIIGISYLIRNVTERKLKEQKIISQNQSLLKIAHIQAHEFRAPLTTIMGLMSLIKEDAYSPPSEYMQFLEQAVDALDTTIRHIVSDIDNTVINDYVSDLNNH